MSRDLNDLSPVVRPKVDAFLASCKAAALDVLVTCTLRTMAEQAALYAVGRTVTGKGQSPALPMGRVVTRAKPGQSAHNFGMAVDIVPMVSGKPDWEFDQRFPDPAWSKVGRLGMLAGLRWYGAPDAPFVEGCHFEQPDWRALCPPTPTETPSP